MKETVQQYIARILGNVAGRNPLAVQRATAKKLATLTRGLSPGQLRRKPAPGKWSIAEILAHLADAELVTAYRLRMILNTPRTPIQAYDQDVWAANGQYARQPAQRSLAEFRTLREKNLALLRAIPRTHWQRYGMHSERGKETLTRVTQMMAGHDLNHLQQIAAISRKLRAR
jgi:hypothetical protein